MTQPVELETAIKAAVMSLLLHQPFLGFVLSKLNFKEDKDTYLKNIKTAATNGRDIMFNGEFMLKLPPKQRVFVVAHETMHCILGSMVRRGNRDPEYWNMASDYVINDMVRRQGSWIDMPTWVLYDPKYSGWSAEQVYADLLKNKATKKETMDLHLEPRDPDEPGEHPTQKELEANEDSMRKIVIESYQRSQMAGKDLGSIKEFIDDLLKPKINWRALLMDSLQSVFKDDITWAVPNRRSISPSIILPSARYQETVDLCLGFDTSGSITDQMRVEFLSEVSGLLEYYQNFNLHLWCFDTQVHNPQVYNQYNVDKLPEYRPGGGGGTDIGCNFKWMKKHDIVPSQFVCMTDGYNCSPSWGDPLYCPTTWIIHSNPKPDVPFGRFALYEELTGKN